MVNIQSVTEILLVVKIVGMNIDVLCPICLHRNSIIEWMEYMALVAFKFIKIASFIYWILNKLHSPR